MFVGLDLGTTNIKALLVDREGRVLGRASAPVELIHTPDGGVEQDVDDIWRATLSALKRLSQGADTSQAEAVGVSAQGGAMQLLDTDDRPVGRVVSWLDPRGGRHNARLTRQKGEAWFGERIGHGVAAICIGQALRLREADPGAIGPDAKIGLVGDVIVGRLCGRRAHDATSLSLAMLYNPALRRADPDVLGMLGLREDQLPDLLGPCETAGRLLGEAAEATGLPAGIPVGPALHDQYASAVGAGATRPGDVMFGAGTAWVLLAVTDRLAPPIVPQAFVCTHLVEGLYGQMLSMANGGSAFDWARRTLAVGDVSDDALDAMIAEVPPGGEGARFWPLLAEGSGARHRPGASGKFAGLRLSHQSTHLMRAVVEGLALELNRHADLLRGAELPVERLAMTGGAAQSRVTPCVVADAVGVPVDCMAEGDVSALGAAVAARALVEPGGLADLAEAMKPETRAIEPGPSRAVYREMFEGYMEGLEMARKRI